MFLRGGSTADADTKIVPLYFQFADTTRVKEL
jgi:hypothetical protein